MRLVGAPRLHVRVPFILEGLVQGALGGLVAGAAVWGIGRLLAAPLQVLGPDVTRLPASGWALLVAAPALAGAVSAALSVEAVLRRHAQLER
jgi:cell division protein FtsX